MKSIFVFLTSILSMVSVMAQQTIDVHCHNVLPEFTEFLERHRAAMEETFPLPKWDVNPHLEFMENADIGKAILSMPAPQPYYGDTDECTRIVRFYNEASARLKSDYPGKLLFCASLPLPDVEAAIKEAAAILESQGVKYRNLSIDSDSEAGKYASDIMAFPTTILVDRNGNIVGDPMLGGIDNQENYDTLMKQIQSVIEADSVNK